MPMPTRSIVRRTAVRAFTLIEVLIVIGILGLLMTIAVIGFKVVGGVSRDRVTGVALSNTSGLIAAYKETSPVTKLIESGTGSTMAKMIASPFRWRQANPATVASPSNDTDLSNARAVAPGADAGASADPVFSATAPSSDQQIIQERYLRDETARAIKRLMSVPANRKAIEAMSPDRVQKIRVPVDPSAVLSKLPDGTFEYASTVNTFESVVLLDGTGHPIYLIPGGGLWGVNRGYRGSGDKTDKMNYDLPFDANEQRTIIRSPDRGPFWASPGPDGDLTTGDDNAYSFDGK